MARGQCGLWKNPRADRSRCAAVAQWGNAAKHSLPDLYKSCGIRDAKPAVQEIGTLDHVGRGQTFGRVGNPWRKVQPQVSRY